MEQIQSWFHANGVAALDLQQALWFCTFGFSAVLLMHTFEYLKLSPAINRYLKHDMSREDRQGGADFVNGLVFVLGTAVLLLAGIVLFGYGEPILERVEAFRVTAILMGVLAVCHLWWIWRMSGPFGGGSDYVLATGLLCVSIAHASLEAAPYAMGYLGVQLFLSYFIAGWVKAKNRQWWSGEALRTVVLSSQYRVPVWMRRLSERSSLPTKFSSWATIVFELGIVLAIFNEVSFMVFLLLAAAFHFFVFTVFGLNRFFWAWIAAFPALFFLRSLFL